MNIEAENLDSLRKLVRDLQSENRELKAKLKEANITFEENSVFEEKVEDISEYDPDQGDRIISRFITEDTAKERAEAQGIGHFVYPRFTRVIDTKETKNDINGAYKLS